MAERVQVPVWFPEEYFGETSRYFRAELLLYGLRELRTILSTVYDCLPYPEYAETWYKHWRILVESVEDTLGLDRVAKMRNQFPASLASARWSGEDWVHLRRALSAAIGATERLCLSIDFAGDGYLRHDMLPRDYGETETQNLAGLVSACERAYRVYLPDFEHRRPEPGESTPPPRLVHHGSGSTQVGHTIMRYVLHELLAPLADTLPALALSFESAVNTRALLAEMAQEETSESPESDDSSRPTRPEAGVPGRGLLSSLTPQQVQHEYARLCEEYYAEYGHRPSQVDLAESLFVSRSTLKRFLSAQGMSWPPRLELP